MRRVLALIQLAGLAAAVAAIFDPNPRKLLHDFAGYTIYPWWTLVLVVVAGLAAACSLVAPVRWLPTTAAAACVAGVLSAQVAALGAWAYKHWLPAFGMGGGYAGDVAELKRLAVIVAGAGATAALASVAQLVVDRQWPLPVAEVATARRVRSGASLLVGLPLLLAAIDRDGRDVTSLGAFALVYSIPWGLSLVGAGWLRREATFGVLGAGLLSAALSAVSPSYALSTSTSSAVFAVVALALAVLVMVERKEEAAGAGGGGS